MDEKYAIKVQAYQVYIWTHINYSRINMNQYAVFFEIKNKSGPKKR